MGSLSSSPRRSIRFSCHCRLDACRASAKLQETSWRNWEYRLSGIYEDLDRPHSKGHFGRYGLRLHELARGVDEK
jgi:hypothetical protein